MSRLYFDAVSGALDASLGLGVTTMSSPGLQDMGAVTAPDVTYIAIFTADADGRIVAYEVVEVTAHTAGAGTATVVRGYGATSPVAWAVGARWRTVFLAEDAARWDLGGGTLDDLSDVDTTTTPPTDGQALVWDDANSEWIPGDVAASGGGGSGVFTGCSLTKSVDQAITTGTLTAVTFDGEDFDSDGFHDNSTNPSRITIPTGKGGTYLFVGSAGFIQPNVKVEMYLAFSVNGVEQVRTRVRTWNSEVSVENPQLRTAALLRVSAGDYVEFKVYHEHGSNRSVQAAVSQFQCALMESTGTVIAGARAYKSAANQSVANNTHTKVTLDVEAFDDESVFASSTYTVPATGRYRIRGQVEFAVGVNNRHVGIWKNGVGTGTRLAQTLGPAGSGLATRLGADTGLIDLTAGDTIELSAWQDSGGALDVIAGAGSTFLSVERVRGGGGGSFSASNAYIVTSETRANAAFGDLATVGPAVTVTTGAEVLVTLSATVTNPTTGAFADMAVEVSGATTIAAPAEGDRGKLRFRTPANTSTGVLGFSRTFKIDGLTAGSNTFTCKYAMTSGTGTWADREITVIPL